MITNKETLAQMGYKINDRTAKSVSPITRHLNKFGVSLSELPEETILYFGAEHTKKPKLPNVTFLPDISYGGWKITGSTFGHQHTQYQKEDQRPFQEIYEFQNYGGMLLRSQKSTNLVLMYPGDKAIVGTNESMTIFNLGNLPLSTLDYANPEMNSATKELETSIGPPAMFWTNRGGTLFTINPDYISSGTLGPHQRIILPTTTKGKNLLMIIEEKKNEFYNCGIKIISRGNIPEHLKTELSKPLEQLVSERNQVLFEALQM